MSKPRFTTQQMAAAGIIAAIYAALTLLLPIPQYGVSSFVVSPFASLQMKKIPPGFSTR